MLGWQLPAGLAAALVLVTGLYLVERANHGTTRAELTAATGKVAELRADVKQSRQVVIEAERINQGLADALAETNRHMADLARQQRELEAGAASIHVELAEVAKNRQQQAAQRRQDAIKPPPEYMAEILARALGAP